MQVLQAPALLDEAGRHPIEQNPGRLVPHRQLPKSPGCRDDALAEVMHPRPGRPWPGRARRYPSVSDFAEGQSAARSGQSRDHPRESLRFGSRPRWRGHRASPVPWAGSSIAPVKDPGQPEGPWRRRPACESLDELLDRFASPDRRRLIGHLLEGVGVLGLVGGVLQGAGAATEAVDARVRLRAGRSGPGCARRLLRLVGDSQWLADRFVPLEQFLAEHVLR